MPKRKAKSPTKRTLWTPRRRLRDWKAPFLRGLAELGNVKRACVALGIGRSTIYQAIATDADFKAACEAAHLEARETLEAEAWRRAVDGVAKPVVFRGRLTKSHVREYSDRLLVVLLRANWPEKYGQRMTVDHQWPLVERLLREDKLSDAQIEAVINGTPADVILAMEPQGHA